MPRHRPSWNSRHPCLPSSATKDTTATAFAPKSSIVVPSPSFQTNPTGVILHSFSKRAYKGRNVIERCFCRLKDFRRVATRYDKLARNFLAAVHLAAIVAYWIN